MIRARVTDGLSLATGAKALVSENASHGNNLDLGFAAPAATDNVTSVGITQATGLITITYTARAGNGTLLLTPYDGAVLGTNLTNGTVPTSSITWDCTAGTLATQYLPSSCR